MNLKELYQEIILEHGKNPRNLGKTENYNKDAKGNNPLCGDNVHVYLKLNEQRKVEDISFEGEWMCNINGFSIYNDRFN